MWTNPNYAGGDDTLKITVNNACVTSTSLYCSGIGLRAGHAEKAKHIPSDMHPPYPRNVLSYWQYADVLSRPSMDTLLITQTAVVGSCPRKEDGIIQKDIPYGEPTLGREPLVALTDDIQMST